MRSKRTLSLMMLTICLLAATNAVLAGYDPVTGRFQQQDPVGTGPRVVFTDSGPKFVGLMGPTPPSPQIHNAGGVVSNGNQGIDSATRNFEVSQYADSMNLYEYVSSNPLMLVDPYGLWGSDTHQTRTYSWAANDNRMKGWAAEQVAISDDNVDPPYLKWPFHTTSANLSWHFDIPHNATPNWGTSDSRYVHAERELTTAINICGQAKVDCSAARLAVTHLGMALHPVQDWFAHGTWDPTWKSALNWRAHPPETDDADKDYRHSPDRILRDPVRDGLPAHPAPLFQTGSTRIIGTKHRTLEYLARFKNSLNKQGVCYCMIYGRE